MSRPINELARPSILEIKPYFPGKPIEEVERELGLTDVIKLASNENPLGPSPQAVAAIKKAAEKVNFYPDSNCFYLKENLAKHLGIDPGMLIIGNGSDELLKLIAEAFLNEGEEVICGNPSFSEYDFVTQIMAGKMIQIPLQNLTYDLRSIADRITPSTKLIFICNPNNPTGTIVTYQEVEEFMKRVPDDVLVIFDEAYYEYVTDPEFPDSLKYIHQGRRVIVLRTFSKIYGLAGLRVGYGIATPDIIDCLMRVREPFNVNSIAQAGALAGLADQVWIKQAKEVNTQGRDYLYRELTAMDLEYAPTQGNFIFINVKTDGVEVGQRMMRAGVIVRPGNIFGYPEYIRVTIGTKEQNERFIKVLRQVLTELKG
ncbi:MAG: histidinol-phosphate transaminase [Syntrophomonadaceae bacterium]|nr:histidinol-phosphate transaminase [Syntrophomonadaceae bacterium]